MLYLRSYKLWSRVPRVMGETENAWASVLCVLALVQGVPVVTNEESPERILRRGHGFCSLLCQNHVAPWLLGTGGAQGFRKGWARFSNVHF